MTAREYQDEYGEYIEDLQDEWKHNIEEYCGNCGCKMKLIHEVYPIGDRSFTRNEFVCPNCDDYDV